MVASAAPFRHMIPMRRPARILRKPACHRAGCFNMTSNVRVLRRPASAADRRVKVDWPAKCGAAGRMESCRILDISPDGARIVGPVNPAGDNGVLLFFEHASPVRATIAWRNKDRVGLRFREQQAWVQDNCARRFDAAAWLR
jgi:hypothetical protein